MTAGLKTIIALSFVRPSPAIFTIRTSANKPHQVLALGFLLVILSCALYKAYQPLLVVATFVVAPLPNLICGRFSSADDFSAEPSSSAIVDFGRFCTGFFVAMGIALPIILAHSAIITVPAMVMSIIGGVLIYGTIITFGAFFKEEQEF
jgi:hypothetical protein